MVKVPKVMHLDWRDGLHGEHTIACGLCSSIRAFGTAMLTRCGYWILCRQYACHC